MYKTLYENPKIQQNFYHENEKEVSISSIRQSPVKSSLSTESESDADPEIIAAKVAATWSDGTLGRDTRPRFVDKLTGQKCLLDTGSALTAIAAGPNDTVDPNLSLIAANGSRIGCCGYKKIQIQINRKKYDIVAAIAQVKDTIIGWDFIKKHKLSIIWNEFDDALLYDRKAKVSTILEYISIPHMSKPHLYMVQTLSTGENSEVSAFDVAAMREIDSEAGEQKSSRQIMPEKYEALLQEFPSLLKMDFSAKVNGEKVYHYIDTKDHPPCKAKLRPLMRGSPKEVKGKESWQEPEFLEGPLDEDEARTEVLISRTRRGPRSLSSFFRG